MNTLLVWNPVLSGPDPVVPALASVLGATTHAASHPVTTAAWDRVVLWNSLEWWRANRIHAPARIPVIACSWRWADAQHVFSDPVGFAGSGLTGMFIPQPHLTKEGSRVRFAFKPYMPLESTDPHVLGCAVPEVEGRDWCLHARARRMVRTPTYLHQQGSSWVVARSFAHLGAPRFDDYGAYMVPPEMSDAVSLRLPLVVPYHPALAPLERGSLRLPRSLAELDARIRQPELYAPKAGIAVGKTAGEFAKLIDDFI